MKYQPIKDISIGGVIMLNRAKLGSDEKEEVRLGQMLMDEFLFLFLDRGAYPG